MTKPVIFHDMVDIVFHNFFFFLSLFILRGEKDHERGRDREEERESQAGSVLSEQNPTWGSSLRTVRS